MTRSSIDGRRSSNVLVLVLVLVFVLSVTVPVTMMSPGLIMCYNIVIILLLAGTEEDLLWHMTVPMNYLWRLRNIYREGSIAR